MTIFKSEDIESNDQELLVASPKWLPVLSYRQRVFGFVLCLVTGMVL